MRGGGSRRAAASASRGGLRGRFARRVVVIVAHREATPVSTSTSRTILGDRGSQPYDQRDKGKATSGQEWRETLSRIDESLRWKRLASSLERGAREARARGKRRRRATTRPPRTRRTRTERRSRGRSTEGRVRSRRR